MASGANDVDIVVGLKASTYTAGMKEIKKSLGELDTQTKEFSTHTTSNMQAASAGIRLLDNPLGNNVRAIERLISQSKVLSTVFQAAFPVVGAVAAGSILFKLGNDVAEFIKKTQEMPRNLELGFRALNQSAMQADDMIKVANDRLDDQIAKLEHKPTRNGAALALDEARAAADRYAEALGRASKSFDQVVKENQSDTWDSVVGNGSTAGVVNSVNLYNKKMEDLGSQNAIALHDGDRGLSADLVKQMKDLTDAEKVRLKADIAMRTGKENLTQGDTGEVSRLDYAQIHGDQTKPLIIDRAALMHMNLSEETQGDEAANGKKQGQVVDAQTAADNARKAADAARKIIEETLKAWDQDLEIFKKWQTYEADNVKISGDDYRDREKSNFLSSDDNNQLNQSGAGSAARIAAMRQSIDVNKENSDLIAQQALDMSVATGQISRMDAARQQATIHTNEYTAALEKLQDQAANIASSKAYTSEEARQADLLNNKTAQGQLGVSRGIQVDQDSQNINPAASSASAGFKNAINEFVDASQDAAKQMQELATNTLQGLNQQIVAAMSGQRTDFSNFGAGVFRSAAGTGLQKAEGSAIGMLPKSWGLHQGKLGTKGNPMHVTSDDKNQPGGGGGGFGTGGGGNDPDQPGGGSQSGFMGMVNKMFGTSFGGGAQGPGYDGLDDAQGISQNAFQNDQMGGGLSTDSSDSSDIGDITDAFAYGGAINGPALVGEQGPELFVPQGQGNIIPNHKLKNMGGGGTTIHIDATGSTDPAQTRVQVMRGIQAAAPHISAATVQSQQQNSRRTPPSQRK